jgi:hypothetical protein
MLLSKLTLNSDHVQPRNTKKSNSMGIGMPRAHNRIQPIAPFSFLMFFMTSSFGLSRKAPVTARYMPPTQHGFLQTITTNIKTSVPLPKRFYIGGTRTLGSRLAMK